MPIYGLRFRALGQTIYYSGPPDLKPGGHAVVALEQGEVLACVVSGPLTHLSRQAEQSLPTILRPADDDDMQRGEENKRLAHEAQEFCKRCICERKLDMKLVDVEFFFDRTKVIFYFTAPSRIDFRDLVKDLVHKYRVRIELRQIGVRHETQMVGAMGNCGMTCCCRRYLRKFAPVTIRMAKEQNLFLNPAKISGICGRLLCCLSYEQENYDNFHAICPRIGKKYQTDMGGMKVLRANMFHNSVTVVTEDSSELTLPLEEWQALAPHRAETARFDTQKQQPKVIGDTLLVVSATPETVDSLDFTGDAGLPESTVVQIADTLQTDGVAVAQSDGHHRRKRRRKTPQ